MKFSKDNKFYQVKLSALKTERQQNVEAVKAYEKKRIKKMKRKRKILDYKTRHEEAHRNNKIKSINDFDEEHANSIKSLAVEKKSSVPLTTRFMKGKMLMFAKISLQGFIYDRIDVFCFPDETVQKIYEKYKIEKCFLYQNLADADGTSLFFVFICNINYVVNEKESRNILSEVMVQSEIIERLHLSDDFWQNFNVQNKLLKKQVGLYEVENINHTNTITVAVNPK